MKSHVGWVIQSLTTTGIYGIFALSIKDGPLKNKFQRDSEITPEECFSILTARIKLKMILSFSNKPSQISVNIDLVI